MPLIACADCDNVLAVVPKDKDADNVDIPICNLCHTGRCDPDLDFHEGEYYINDD